MMGCARHMADCRDTSCPDHGTRPPTPSTDTNVWYRGWEVGYSPDADFWSNEGWIAYKGGCDLGAPEVRAGTYEACLDLIDDEECE